MDTNRAAEHLQVIRTLMERSTLYRRALAPISLLTGALGLAAAAGGWMLAFETSRAFVGYWLIVSTVCITGAYLIARQQALKDAEPFWSSPTKRVTSALAPPLFVGLIAGLLSLACPGWDFIQPWALPAFWMVLHGSALHSAGFFMTRGIKLVGWIFIVCGCALMISRCFAGAPLALRQGHLVMGAVFGGVHLAYGLYLRFTEKGSPPA
jgi:multisubunit Na+/H+ antiporter MnhB subunit